MAIDWRETPRRPEALIEILGAEIPERSVPRRAVASGLVWTSRDVPAFDDLFEETALQQPLPVGSAEVGRLDGDLAVVL